MIINIKGYDVQIDEEDYDMVKEYTWRICSKEAKEGLLYFHSNTKRDPITHKFKDVRLHRLIMGCTTGDGMVVDHINHDTLNNMKCNLRITTQAGNTQNSRISIRNTSGYKGVFYYKRDNLYVVSVKVSGKSYNVGRKRDLVEAARLYDMAAIGMFGEYACINFDRADYNKADIDKVLREMSDGIYSSNTSGYIGVSLRKNSSMWEATLQHKHKAYYLGSYKDPKEAAMVRDKKALELLGDKAILNFPIETYIKEQQDE